MDVRWGEQKEVDRKRRKTIDDIMVAGGRELIDTLWNVNQGLKTAYCSSPHRELIDTLWNVNVTDATAINKMETELIDTLWNVNLSTIAYHCGYFAN